MFENRVLSRIFGSVEDEVTQERRKLHIRLVGHVAHLGEKRNAYNILTGKPKGKRPLGRPRRRWDDNKRILWKYG
jgi:hypothetical protein